MKPIETFFDGYRFRSRLEARWAVFFKTLNIAYEYEKEGYNLDGTYYLPDFWLPQLELWIEIKGEYPTHEEQEKVARLAELTGKRAALFFGNIPGTDEKEEPHIYYYALFKSGRAGLAMTFEWCECPHCGAIGITYPRFPIPALCTCSYRFLHLASFDLKPQPNTSRIQAAFQAARAARFEHKKN